MRRLLLFLILGSLPLSAQTATQNNFSSNVQGITIGTYHCYFWFHVVAGWDFEAACYGPGNAITLIDVDKQAATHQKSYNICFSGEISPTPCTTKPAYISWLIIPSGSQLIYSLAGRGPDDTSDLIVNGTI